MPLSEQAGAEDKQSLFMKTLRQHNPKTRRITHNTRTPTMSLEADLQAMLEKELEDGTWAGYARTWSEYQEWIERRELETSGRTACLWAMSVLREPAER